MAELNSTIVYGTLQVASDTTTNGIVNIVGNALTDTPTLGAELLTGGTWTSADWTGNNTTGWTHTAGNVSPLNYSSTVTIGGFYQIQVIKTGSTTGTCSMTIGGAATGTISATNTTYYHSPKATATTGLRIIPTSDFNGTIVVSVKEISIPSISLINLKSSNGTAQIEMRANTGLNNTFIGYASGRYNTTGQYNTTLGSESMRQSTTGYRNVSVGQNAMYLNTTGYENVAIGYSASQASISGYANVAIGAYSLLANTGGGNTACGQNSLQANTTGVSNTAIGFQSGYGINTGYYNTMVGTSSGRTTTTGTSNTLIGFYAGYHASQKVDAANSMALGANTYTTASNQVVIGDASITEVRLGQTGLAPVTSGTISTTGVMNITGTTATDTPTLGAELLTGGTWTSTDWTGDNTAGWVHTTGNVSPLSYSATVTIGNLYQIQVVKTGATAGSCAMTIGGASTRTISGTNATYYHTPKATATTGLVITPTSTFDGTIVISVKQITGVSTALINLKSSAGTLQTEFRANTGLQNTFVGINSGRYNTTGALNTSFGNSSFISNTTGGGNTAFGAASLYTNTTGYSNTAIGQNALSGNTTGYENTAVGYYSMLNLTTGFQNTATGYTTLMVNTTGNQNSAFGYQSLSSNTTGYYNNAFGFNSLVFTTTGNGHTAMGHQAGRTMVTGSNSTFFGCLAGYSASQKTDASNSMALGYSTYTIANNQAIIGNADVTDIYMAQDGEATTRTVGIKTDTTTAQDLTITTGAAHTMVLATPVYDDIIIYGANLRTGNTTLPAFVAFQNSIYAVSLVNGQTDILYGAFEIPHTYKEGTDIEFHIHWSPSTINTGDCVFSLKYSVAAMGGGVFGAEQTKTFTQAGSGVVNTHQYVSNDTNLSGTGIGIGTIIVFALSRPTGDAFTGDAFIHSIGCHYQIDTMGSRDRGVK